jgi:GT2 family glycosyltransferase
MLEAKKTKFSLIMATVGRIEQPRRFLASLDLQTYQDFELIIVDQNPGNELDGVVQPYLGKFPILHLRTARRGAARARNIGLRHIANNVVGFPDDDCWYQPDFLERISDFFVQHPEQDGLTGWPVDENSISLPQHKISGPCSITKKNAWGQGKGLLYCIFLRSSVVAGIGSFDDTLGVGAGTPWGAGEETDYLLRALDAGFKIYHDPTIQVHHPRKAQLYDADALARAYSYGVGLGRVLRKHRYPLWFIFFKSAQTIVIACLAISRGDLGRFRFYWARLRGRIFGWLQPL